MTNISISKLKTNPSSAINWAQDYPLAVQNRNKTQAYLIGTSLFDKLMSYIEDYMDTEAVEETDFSSGVDFEKVAEELGI
jgi:PHD/YefM family antitoxin component YafN of YafNO toxin-antitoxin module